MLVAATRHNSSYTRQLSVFADAIRSDVREDTEQAHPVAAKIGDGPAAFLKARSLPRLEAHLRERSLIRIAGVGVTDLCFCLG